MLAPMNFLIVLSCDAQEKVTAESGLGSVNGNVGDKLFLEAACDIWS